MLLFLVLLSLTGGAGLSASPSYLRLPPFPLFGRAGAAAVRPHRTGACRMGRPLSLAGPHTERPVRSHGSSPLEVGLLPFYPTPHRTGARLV
jgi:hypothetical protein